MDNIELNFINLIRNHPEQGRKSLEQNPVLMSVARLRAKDMFTNNYASHVGPDGKTPNMLAREYGYRLPSNYSDGNSIESLVTGKNTTSSILSAFLNSLPHRTHILSLTKFFTGQTNFGVGFFEDIHRITPYWYFFVILTAHPEEAEQIIQPQKPSVILIPNVSVAPKDGVPTMEEPTPQKPLPPVSTDLIHLDDFKTHLSRIFGIQRVILDAVIIIESGPNGPFNNFGHSTLRFEPHLLASEIPQQLWEKHFKTNPVERWRDHFFRWNENSAWIRMHKNQAQELEIFNFAKTLNEEGAYRSTSFGSTQILGRNHGILGYPTAKEMAYEFNRTEAAQIAGFFAYIYNTTALSALKRRDYRAFAASYNGSGQAAFYERLIINKIRELGGTP